MCDYCSWISQILAKINAETKAMKRKKISRANPVIVVHGGAGKIPRYARKYMLEEVKKAAVTAYNDLIKGCCSVDAVERAICHMESKKYFNCAYGGSLDANNEVVMDAAIMDQFRVGCIGAVRNIEHPIRLARKVLEETDRTLIVEEGAQRFALKMGIPTLSPDQLIADTTQHIDLASKTSLYKEKNNSKIEDENNNEKSQELLQNINDQFEKEYKPRSVITKQEKGEEGTMSDVSSKEIIGNHWKSKESLEIEPEFLQIGAVGAVAYDRKKRLASGTSTAGEQGKLNGIVSATGAVVGCGIYTDQAGSVSVSGCDKAIYSYAPAREIIQKLREEVVPNEVVSAILANFEEETGMSDVGAIVLTAEGIPSVCFKCVHFPWAYCDDGYVHYGCAKNEKFSEKIEILGRSFDCMCEDLN